LPKLLEVPVYAAATSADATVKLTFPRSEGSLVQFIEPVNTALADCDVANTYCDASVRHPFNRLE